MENLSIVELLKYLATAKRESDSAYEPDCYMVVRGDGSGHVFMYYHSTLNSNQKNVLFSFTDEEDLQNCAVAEIGAAYIHKLRSEPRLKEWDEIDQEQFPTYP